MKLKTLKDLKSCEYCSETIDRDRTQNTCVEKKDLKQKAIKWIKHSLKYRRNMYKMFMEFHNITEEDLK